MSPDDWLLLLAAAIGVLGSLLGAAVGGYVAHLVSQRAAVAQRDYEHRFARYSQLKEAHAAVSMYVRDGALLDGQRVNEREYLYAIQVFDEDWREKAIEDIRQIESHPPYLEYARSIERTMRRIVDALEKELGLPAATDPKPIHAALLAEKSAAPDSAERRE